MGLCVFFSRAAVGEMQKKKLSRVFSSSFHFFCQHFFLLTASKVPVERSNICLLFPFASSPFLLLFVFSCLFESMSAVDLALIALEEVALEGRAGEYSEGREAR